jgi:hypothetical protein
MWWLIIQILVRDLPLFLCWDKISSGIRFCFPTLIEVYSYVAVFPIRTELLAFTPTVRPPWSFSLIFITYSFFLIFFFFFFAAAAGGAVVVSYFSLHSWSTILTEQDGDKTSTFLDLDGSVSGHPTVKCVAVNYYYYCFGWRPFHLNASALNYPVIVNRHLFYQTAGCMYHAAQEIAVYVCDSALARRCYIPLQSLISIGALTTLLAFVSRSIPQCLIPLIYSLWRAWWRSKDPTLSTHRWYCYYLISKISLGLMPSTSAVGLAMAVMKSTRHWQRLLAFSGTLPFPLRSFLFLLFIPSTTAYYLERWCSTATITSRGSQPLCLHNSNSTLPIRLRLSIWHGCGLCF